MVSSNKAWLYDSYFYRNYFQGLCSEKYIAFVSDIVGHCTVATASAKLEKAMNTWVPSSIYALTVIIYT